jgi:glutamate/tyrosine decarboxylase-like PLP-dependent enzyme
MAREHHSGTMRMSDPSELESQFLAIARYAAQRRAGDAGRLHRPEIGYAEALQRFRLPAGLPPAAPDQVLQELIGKAEPGLAAMTGPRFFGWVIGGSNPLGVAADWLTAIWGQNAANHIACPSASAAEVAAAEALLDLLDLPRQASVGFVTGGTMATFTGLAAGRAEVLRRAGWDIEADGLSGAPPIHVVLGEEAHSTVFAALKYLGFGTRNLVRVAVDRNGAMQPGAFAEAVRGLHGPILAVAQAGHINTGACDPFAEIVAAVRARAGWLHVDGAFGLWARAAASTRALTAGIDGADSWTVDGHKWLQTPYDCGYAIVRDPEAHQRAMRIPASYLPGAADGAHNPSDLTPELSRRARGFATWAVLRHKGGAGVEAIIEQSCAMARRFAQVLAREPGVAIRNDVVMNQVAVRLGADLSLEEGDRLTRATIARIQGDGVCFLGGAIHKGEEIIRISVTGETTAEADVDRSCAAIVSAWRAVQGRP